MHGTSREYDESLRAIAPALGIELKEVDDWSRCGASSAHATNYLLGLALPARNLALAEEQGFEDIVAPCAACFSRLATSRHEMAEDEELAKRMGRIIERPFENSVNVLNVVQLLLTEADAIREKSASADAIVPLGELKVAAYYGCLLVRPTAVAGADDTEVPTTMERVISACGAHPVAWNMAVECCGGSFSMSRTSSVVRLGRAIIEDARKAGADLIVTACPMCHSNLDFRQAAWAAGNDDAIPVFYLTQLVGLALGMTTAELGINRHFIESGPLMTELRRRAEGAAAKKKPTDNRPDGVVV
jgi:heterodisulfide reductase subunit B